MAFTKQQSLSRMSKAGVVAVIRAQSTDPLIDITNAVLDGGVPSIGVTMTSQ
jgi:2-keto-3-deoxy-6-phosphogluconate aldolase